MIGAAAPVVSPVSGGPGQDEGDGLGRLGVAVTVGAVVVGGDRGRGTWSGGARRGRREAEGVSGAAGRLRVGGARRREALVGLDHPGLGGGRDAGVGRRRATAWWSRPPVRRRRRGPLAGGLGVTGTITPDARAAGRGGRVTDEVSRAGPRVSSPARGDARGLRRPGRAGRGRPSRPCPPRAPPGRGGRPIATRSCCAGRAGRAASMRARMISSPSGEGTTESASARRARRRNSPYSSRGTGHDICSSADRVVRPCRGPCGS